MKKKHLPIISVLVFLTLILGYTMVQGTAGVIVLSNADGSNTFSMTSSSQLNALINQVASRIKVEMANALQYHPITAPPVALSGQITALANRIKIEFANDIRYHTIAYPKALIGDTTNPFIVQTSTSNAYLYITANELTTMEFQYGFTTGSYPNRVNAALYETTHAIPFSMFPKGQIVYYRVLLVDRSGNQSLSKEYVFTPPAQIFLPFVKK